MKLFDEYVTGGSYVLIRCIHISIYKVYILKHTCMISYYKHEYIWTLIIENKHVIQVKLITTEAYQLYVAL